MKKLITIAAALSLSAIGTLSTASAQSSDDDNPSGPYIGAGYGRFNYHIANLNDVGRATTTIAHSDDNAWKVFAGIRLNPYVAIEGDYINFGSPSDRFTATGSNGNYRVDLSGFAPYVIGTVPL